MPFKPSPEERYQTDNQFNAIVDMMENMIHQAQYTPSELRDAAMLAAIHYEYRRPPKPFIIGDKKWALTREPKEDKDALPN